MQAMLLTNKQGKCSMKIYRHQRLRRPPMISRLPSNASIVLERPLLIKGRTRQPAKTVLAEEVAKADRRAAF